MEIKKMTIDDLNNISSILETDFDDFWNYNILKEELENSNSIYIVIKENEEILGFAGMTIILETAELNNIVIKKNHRGKGYSSILLQKLIELAIESGCLKLNLEVSFI